MECKDELYRILFGPDWAAAAAIAGERMQWWAARFDEWLEDCERVHSRSKRLEDRLAWQDFWTSKRRLPWQAQEADVSTWAEELERSGRSKSTINRRLASLSRFYEFCNQRAVRSASGGGSPAGAEESGFNPARGVKRASIKLLERAEYLSLEEMQALLAAVDRDSSLVGMRDYAMILTALMTGKEIGELRQMRGREVSGAMCQVPGEEGAQGEEGATCDVRRDVSSATCQVPGAESARCDVRRDASPVPDEPSPEGTSAAEPTSSPHAAPRTSHSLPLPVLEAILAYLRASGRLDGMRPEEYIFAPVADPLSPLTAGRAAEWDGERPLSMDHATFFLKRYAGWAGLDPGRVDWRCLRHTSAVLRLEMGEEVEALCSFLNHKSLEHTKHYLNVLASKPKEPLWSPEGAQGASQRRRPGAQPGNQLGLKHGFYASRLPDAVRQALEDLPEEGVLRETAAIRIMMARAFELSLEAETLSESMSLLDHFGKAAVRLSGLLKTQKELDDTGESEMERALRQALEELGEEMGFNKREG